MVLARLRRGLLAGLVAGLLAGLFGFAVGEPLLDRAIELEENAAGHHGEEGKHHEGAAPEGPFGRGEQKAGLFLATTLYGGAVGALFGLASAYFRGRVLIRGEWGRSLGLAAAVFAGAVLVPFLKYPPNPPGVGADPEALTARTLAYLVMVGLCTLAVFFAWRLTRELGGLAAPKRHVLVGVFLISSWGLLLYALPGFEAGAAGTPAELMWGFRLSALGTQAVLWGGIGCAFGLLGERAEARATARAAGGATGEGAR